MNYWQVYLMGIIVSTIFCRLKNPGRKKGIIQLERDDWRKYFKKQSLDVSRLFIYRKSDIREC